MNLNFSSIMIGSEDPKKLTVFYKKVFDQEPDWTDGDWAGFKVGDCMITIGPHSEVKGKNSSPERILLNFETFRVEEEFERIEKTGAKVIAAPYHPGEGEDMTIATFADPDGNYFQLMSPWEENKAN